MSWLYLPVPEADCSRADCSDGGQSATSSGMTTLGESSTRGCEMATWIPLPSGVETCGNLFAAELLTSLEDWLMLSVPDSHASRSAKLEKNAEHRTIETCGQPHASEFAQLSHDGSGWKTYLDSYVGKQKKGRSRARPTSELFWETWPRSGLMRDGVAFLQKKLERHIAGPDCLLLPTPTAGDATRGATTYSRGNPSLLKAVRMIPIPTSRDFRSGKGKTQAERGRTAGASLSELSGGTLNPEWVEWLMGWPIGWTALEPLATDRYQRWLSAHGNH